MPRSTAKGVMLVTWSTVCFLVDLHSTAFHAVGAAGAADDVLSLNQHLSRLGEGDTGLAAANRDLLIRAHDQSFPLHVNFQLPAGPGPKTLAQHPHDHGPGEVALFEHQHDVTANVVG